MVGLYGRHVDFTTFRHVLGMDVYVHTSVFKGFSIIEMVLRNATVT